MTDGNGYLTQAIDQLSTALVSDKPTLACAQGLRAAINAAGLGALDPVLKAEVSRLLFSVAPRIAEHTAGRLAAEHIFVGLGSMAGALSTPDADRFVGLLTFAALLESELRTLYFRDAIATGTQADLALAVARNPLTAPVYELGPLVMH